MFAVLARIFRGALGRPVGRLTPPPEPYHPNGSPGGDDSRAVPTLETNRTPPGLGNIEEFESMAPAQTEVMPTVTRSLALGWLRQMLLIRRFEERSAMLYQNEKIGGFCHLYSGQESVAVGSIGVLREDDYVITAYRDHGHALARGMEPKFAMAELLGKANGCSKGKGGSMHFFDAEKGFLGGHAIVGSHIPIAAGVAFAIKYKGGDQVCLCYFGDGAMDQGALHEAFNMASLWKLPVVYIVENNMMSMGTQLHRHSWTTDLTVRGGPAYGMPGILIDANDIEEMARVTREAVARARAGEGPTFLEAKTYRFRGHSMSDPMKYRSKEEAEKARERDPIVRYETILKERGWIDEAELETLHEKIRQEINEVIAFAENAPEPEPSALFEDITAAPFVPQE